VYRRHDALEELPMIDAIREWLKRVLTPHKLVPAPVPVRARRPR
jgi:hypothetical protein